MRRNIGIIIPSLLKGSMGNVKADPNPDCWEDGLLPKRFLDVTKREELFGCPTNVPCAYPTLGSTFIAIGTVCFVQGTACPKVNVGTEVSASS